MKTVYRAADLRVGNSYRGHKVLGLSTWFGGPIWGTPSGRDKVRYVKGFWEDTCSVDNFLRMVNG